MSGGLFRTDGGARGSSGLDVSDPEIGKAWERVCQGEEEWMLLEPWYESQDPRILEFWEPFWISWDG